MSQELLLELRQEAQNALQAILKDPDDLDWQPPQECYFSASSPARRLAVLGSVPIGRLHVDATKNADALIAVGRVVPDTVNQVGQYGTITLEGNIEGNDVSATKVIFAKPEGQVVIVDFTKDQAESVHTDDIQTASIYARAMSTTSRSGNQIVMLPM